MRFLREDIDIVLDNYLFKREQRLVDLDKFYDIRLEQVAHNRISEEMASLIHGIKSVRSRIFDLLNDRPLSNIDRMALFEMQSAHASNTLSRLGVLGESAIHGDSDDQEARDLKFMEEVRNLKHLDIINNFYTKSSGELWHELVSRWDPLSLDGNEKVFRSDILALEAIRASAAKEAINASNLAQVVDAIKRRKRRSGQSIRIRCEAIPQGAPRYFRWNGAKFEEANSKASSELGFHLLGPSHELIAKLHERLPIGTYLLAYRAGGLMSGTVTPSNRLSYVTRFHLQDQNILIAGDAGFSDFAPSRSKVYYPDILRLLHPLHVVQVAHHGGLNHRFYEALTIGGMPLQNDWSFLLLSHATDDSTRPRAEFSRFVAQFRNDGRNDVSVVFTCRPKREKVESITDMIHGPVSTPSGSEDKGDVRLSFPNPPDSARGKTCWKVMQHPVKV